MIRVGFEAMGTTIEVIAEDNSSLGSVRSLFGRVERQMSRFRRDSELSVINASRRSELELSSNMLTILSVAKKLQELTGGMVDPGVGRALPAWGYDRTFEEISDIERSPDPVISGQWSVSDGLLRREPGVQFDLGGIAKGWVADLAVDEGLALLVSAGGDVRSAIDDAHVEILDPWDGAPVLVDIGAGGLATSSVSRRRWQAGSREVHHIINPHTGAPAETPIISATALCDTATEAEAAAKTVLLMGEEGLAWADDQTWVRAAMATWHNGSVFATHGWELAA